MLHSSRICIRLGFLRQMLVIFYLYVPWFKRASGFLNRNQCLHLKMTGIHIGSGKCLTTTKTEWEQETVSQDKSLKVVVGYNRRLPLSDIPTPLQRTQLRLWYLTSKANTWKTAVLPVRKSKLPLQPRSQKVFHITVLMPNPASRAPVNRQIPRSKLTLTANSLSVPQISAKLATWLQNPSAEKNATLAKIPWCVLCAKDSVRDHLRRGTGTTEPLTRIRLKLMTRDVVTP